MLCGKHSLGCCRNRRFNLHYLQFKISFENANPEIINHINGKLMLSENSFSISNKNNNKRMEWKQSLISILLEPLNIEPANSHEERTNDLEMKEFKSKAIKRRILAKPIQPTRSNNLTNLTSPNIGHMPKAPSNCFN